MTFIDANIQIIACNNLMHRNVLMSHLYFLSSPRNVLFRASRADVFGLSIQREIGKIIIDFASGHGENHCVFNYCLN